MSKIRYILLTAAVATTAACNGREPAPAVDDALRNDLALAAQVRAPAPQQYVGPAELGQYPPLPQGYAPQGYAPGYAPQAYAPQYAPQPQYQPVYAAPAPAPRPATVRRTSSARRSGGSASGTVVYRAPAPQQTRVIKHTKRDAAIGAVAGAAIGVATSSKSDRLKGGLIGAVAGATLGAIIGNNVDVKRVPVPQF